MNEIKNKNKNRLKNKKKRRKNRFNQNPIGSQCHCR